MFVKQIQNLKDINALASQKFENYTKNVWKERAYVNEDGIAPAGSPYPYQEPTGNYIVTGGLQSDNLVHTIGNDIFTNDRYDFNYFNLAEHDNITHSRSIGAEGYPIISFSGVAEERSMPVECACVLSVNTSEMLPSEEAYTIQYEYKVVFNDGMAEGVTVQTYTYTTNGTPEDRINGYTGNLNKFNRGLISTTSTTEGFTRAVYTQQSADSIHETGMLRIGIVLKRPSGEPQGFNFGNVTISFRKIMLEYGTVRSEYVPSEEDGGSDPEVSGTPIGLLFEDVDFNILGGFVVQQRPSPVMVNGYVLESRLPIPITQAVKNALPNIQFR